MKNEIRRPRVQAIIASVIENQGKKVIVKSFNGDVCTATQGTIDSESIKKRMKSFFILTPKGYKQKMPLDTVLSVTLVE